MVEYRTKVNDLFMGFYLNGDINLILANGIPSYMTKHHPLVRFCKENKINLFVPRYYGSFESGGNFSISNCTKAIEESIEFVKSGKAIELFGNNELEWKNEKIFLLGHSFGALPSALTNNSSEIKIILSCPFINLNINEKNGGSAKKDFHFIQRAYPNLYRFGASELIKELENIKPIQNRKFSIFKGIRDNSVSEGEIKFLSKSNELEIFEFDGGHIIDLNLLKKTIFP